MVRLLFLIFSASLLPCVVNSSVVNINVEGKSFVKRASEEEICGAANYYICSDRKTCCPNGFLCQGQGCVRAPDNTSDTDDPTYTDVIITVTVTPSPNSDNKPVLGTGAIAGIAVGGAILLAVAGVAIFFCVRKRRIGKEVLRAYEDPSRNMYDQVVVEGKRISVVPTKGATTTQQRRQTQTNLSPPSEVQELAYMEGAAVGLKPGEQYPQQYQQQPQQYQSNQQQPQQHTYYNQNQEHIQQSSELSTGGEYSTPPPPQPPPQAYAPKPIPDALRVGSPVSPIRADSMGLIPVTIDAADGGQHPYQFSPAPNMIRHHSTPLPPPPHHHHQNTEPIPQASSLPTMPSPYSTSPPPPQTPSPQPPVYYQSQAPSPPSRETSPQQRYQPPQAAYQQYQHQQEGAPQIPPPKNNYPQYPQYQQYP